MIVTFDRTGTNKQELVTPVKATTSNQGNLDVMSINQPTHYFQKRTIIFGFGLVTVIL